MASDIRESTQHFDEVREAVKHLLEVLSRAQPGNAHVYSSLLTQLSTIQQGSPTITIQSILSESLKTLQGSTSHVGHCQANTAEERGEVTSNINSNPCRPERIPRTKRRVALLRPARSQLDVVIEADPDLTNENGESLDDSDHDDEGSLPDTPNADTPGGETGTEVADHISNFVEAIGTESQLRELKQAWGRRNPVPKLNPKLTDVAIMLRAIDGLERATFVQDILRRFYLKALVQQHEKVATEIRRSGAPERTRGQYKRRDSEIISALIAQAWPDTPRGSSLATSSPSYRNRHRQIKRRIAAGRKWATLDATFGLGTFALVPAGPNAVVSSTRMERFTKEEFGRLLDGLQQKRNQIEERIRNAACIMGLGCTHLIVHLIQYTISVVLAKGMGSIPTDWQPVRRYYLVPVQTVGHGSSLTVVFRSSDPTHRDQSLGFKSWHTVLSIRKAVAKMLAISYTIRAPLAIPTSIKPAPIEIASDTDSSDVFAGERLCEVVGGVVVEGIAEDAMLLVIKVVDLMITDDVEIDFTSGQPVFEQASTEQQP
ncbi:hypothetical protein BX600DRAFT_431793 [Xylariales sp. PMI_506]|nr:hypothetical protein BX600DRAFT_431793 [Xylariales sp. PMI_506]